MGTNTYELFEYCHHHSFVPAHRYQDTKTWVWTFEANLTIIDRNYIFVAISGGHYENASCVCFIFFMGGGGKWLLPIKETTIR